MVHVTVKRMVFTSFYHWYRSCLETGDLCRRVCFLVGIHARVLGCGSRRNCAAVGIQKDFPFAKVAHEGAGAFGMVRNFLLVYFLFSLCCFSCCGRCSGK